MAFRRRRDKCSTAPGAVRPQYLARARVFALLVICTLGAWAGRSEAQYQCFYPGNTDGATAIPPLQTYASSACAQIQWPTSWTAVGAQTEANETQYANKAYNLVGSGSDPGIYIAKGYVYRAAAPAINANYLFFRIRVAYDSNATPVDATTGAPFASASNGTQWVMLTTNDPTTTPRPLFALAWDTAQSDWTRHGLEMTYQTATAATTWGANDLEDVDGTQNSKGVQDIDGGTGNPLVYQARQEGYVRTVNAATFDGGSATFIEIAVSCKYFTRVNAIVGNNLGGFNPCAATALYTSAASLTGTADNIGLWANNIAGTDIFGIGAPWTAATAMSAASWSSTYNPTAVVVSEVASHPTPAGLQVAWQTASEVGAAGFNLYRVHAGSGARTLVNRTLVPAVQGSPNGGRYAVVDPDGSPVAETLYLLEEIEAGGKHRTYGPYLVRPTPAGSGVPGIGKDGWGRSSRSDETGSPRRAMASRRTSMLRTASAGPRQPTAGGAARVVVAEPGLQVVTSSDVAGALGISEPSARTLIRARGVRLAGPEGEVACEPDPSGRRLYFLGTPLDTTWASTAVYMLERGRCRAFGSTGGTNARTRSTTPTIFVDRARLERNLVPVPSLFSATGEDFWLWSFLTGGSASEGSKSFEVSAPDATGMTGELTLALQGASNSGNGQDHHVQASLNGIPLGEVRWVGAGPASASFTLPPGAVQADAPNVLRLDALLDTGVPYSVLGLDSLELSWERRALAHGDRLSLPKGVTGDVVAAGFTTGDVWVLDVSRPGRPSRLKGVGTGCRSGTCFARFSAGWTADRSYLAVRPAAAFQPVVQAIPARAALNTLAGAGIDYLVITSPALETAAAELAALRQAQGRRAAVVTTDRIYGQYSSGNLDPLAIRAFLSDVHRTWQRPPTFVVLAGSGSFDGRDLLGKGDGHVPPLMVGTPFGLTASDVALADVEGDDGVPEFAIGRIPASTDVELGTYVAKLRAREANPGPWSDRAFFLAGSPDEGGDFPADGQAAMATLGGSFASEQAVLAGDKAATRARTLQALAAGPGLFHFYGHAGSDRLASEGLLTSADVASLGNASRTPFAMFMTCAAGLHGFPGYDSLAAKLVLQGDGGTIATWASSAWEMHADSRLLSQQALARIGASPGMTAGEAVREALEAGRRADIPRWTRLAYNLFGDPAVRISP